MRDSELRIKILDGEVRQLKDMIRGLKYENARIKRENFDSFCDKLKRPNSELNDNVLLKYWTMYCESIEKVREQVKEDELSKFSKEVVSEMAKSCDEYILDEDVVWRVGYITLDEKGWKFWDPDDSQIPKGFCSIECIMRIPYGTVFDAEEGTYSDLPILPLSEIARFLNKSNYKPAKRLVRVGDEVFHFIDFYNHELDPKFHTMTRNDPYVCCMAPCRRVFLSGRALKSFPVLRVPGCKSCDALNSIVNSVI